MILSFGEMPLRLFQPQGLPFPLGIALPGVYRLDAGVCYRVSVARDPRAQTARSWGEKRHLPYTGSFRSILDVSNLSAGFLSRDVEGDYHTKKTGLPMGKGRAVCADDDAPLCTQRFWSLTGGCAGKELKFGGGVRSPCFLHALSFVTSHSSLHTYMTMKIM